MLNIPESIPPPELTPPIPKLHPTQFQRFRNWTEFHKVPFNSVKFHAIPDLEKDGFSGNFAEFRLIPGSLELIPIPEYLTDFHFHPHPHIWFIFGICARFPNEIPDPKKDGSRRNSV